jgi:hypothetical protein
MVFNKEAFFRQQEIKLTNLFQVALTQLAKNNNLPNQENDLNRKLCLTLRTENFKLNKLGNGLDRLPSSERPKQPVNEEDLTSEDRDKRPDFTYSLTNKYALTPEYQELDYHIECKRLGSSHLSNEYVDNGIKRFGSSSHSYGEGVNYGIMIGYIQKSDHKTIQTEVNNRLGTLSFTRNNIPETITIPDEDGLSKAQQNITRTEVLPGEFKLQHLWIDLRVNDKPKTGKS